MKDTTTRDPFRNPDGSRADIDNLLNQFISFDDESVWGGLSMRTDNLSARVIVG